MATRLSIETEVLIVGGGPAGLATAIEASRAGARVVLIERATPPFDKACGEGLMPDGVLRLSRLGVDVERLRSAPFRGIRYLDGEQVTEGRLVRPGLGIRRLDLHARLVERAEHAGVDLRWGVSARGLAPGGVATDHGVLRARWIVGADGLHSPLRRASGLGAAPPRRRRFGVRRHYEVSPWTDHVEVHWTHRCEAYVTPVAPGTVSVALLWEGPKSTFDILLGRFPALAARLEAAPVVSEDRGAGPLEQRVSRVTRGNLALVGDAAGYVDAISGEGLSLAFHQAEVLVRALGRGDLGAYASAHARSVAQANRVTRALLVAEARPWLRSFLMRRLAARRGRFERLLALLVREPLPDDLRTLDQT